MPRLIWVFGGRTLTLMVLSCRGSTNTAFSATWLPVFRDSNYITKKASLLKQNMQTCYWYSVTKKVDISQAIDTISFQIWHKQANVYGQKGKEIRILRMKLSYISSFHLSLHYFMPKAVICVNVALWSFVIEWKYWPLGIFLVFQGFVWYYT